MLVFACLSPHAPIFLPTVGSLSDREKVKVTITALESLAPKLTAARPDTIIISSPHPDWGVEVPLYFLITQGVKVNTPLRWNSIDTSGILGKKLQFKIQNYQNADNVTIEQFNNLTIYPILTTPDSLHQHFLWGQEIIKKIPEKLRVGWIASGDMSHVLKKDGPYGFHASGPKFDQKFIELLKKKDVDGILSMEPKLIDEAGVCGLWSFCMLLGALEENKKPWWPEILSYEYPFGVGYLVCNINLK